MTISAAYELIIDKFVAWSEGREDIRFACVIGSRARRDRPADEWSDLDLIFLAAQPETYISDSSWLSHFGQVRLTFLEGTAVGEFKERRALYDGGLDVDFVPLPVSVADESWPQEIVSVFSRGYRVLVDKDGRADSIPRVPIEQFKPVLPTAGEFDQLANDFLYHAVWSAKKLCRGETWLAKMCTDGYLKLRLLKVLEWHTQVRQGEAYEAWHGGRFFDQWADPRALDGLGKSFGRYDAAEIWSALTETVKLFGWLSEEVAQSLNMRDHKDSVTYVQSLLEAYENSRMIKGARP